MHQRPFYTLYVLNSYDNVGTMHTVSYYPNRAAANVSAALLDAKLFYPAHTLVTVTTRVAK